MTHEDPAQGSDRAFGATALCTTLLAALLQAPLAAQTAVLETTPAPTAGATAEPAGAGESSASAADELAKLGGGEHPPHDPALRGLRTR